MGYPLTRIDPLHNPLSGALSEEQLVDLLEAGTLDTLSAPQLCACCRHLGLLTSFRRKDVSHPLPSAESGPAESGPGCSDYGVAMAGFP